MKRYGEIGRIRAKDGIYILGANKESAPHFRPEPFIPILWFSRTLKSAKKYRPKHRPNSGEWEKFDLRHSIVGDTFNWEIMKKGVRLFQQYFNEIKPVYVAFGVYDEDPDNIKEKRYSLYSRTIIDCGYEFDREYIDELGYDAYGFKRKGEDSGINT